VKVIVSDRRLALLRVALVVLPGLCLAGCGLGGGSSYPKSRYAHQGSPHYKTDPSVFDAASGSSDNPDELDATIGDKNRVWLAALQTLSFMPLVSANATSGVIVTDWYSDPNAPNQRQKVDAHILGREPRPESLRLSVLRQERGNDGTWVDAPADKTAAELTDEILKRARKIQPL